MTYTATRHQRAIMMFWPHFGEAVTLFIFLWSVVINLWSAYPVCNVERSACSLPLISHTLISYDVNHCYDVEKPGRRTLTVPPCLLARTLLIAHSCRQEAFMSLLMDSLFKYHNPNIYSRINRNRWLSPFLTCRMMWWMVIVVVTE